MEKFHLDVNSVRKLTPEEEARLEALPIDYSDIPELGDEFFSKATVVWPPLNSYRLKAGRIDSD